MASLLILSLFTIPYCTTEEPGMAPGHEHITDPEFGDD